MSSTTRRDFLKATAAAGGAVALAPLTANAQGDSNLQMAIARWKGAPVAEAGVGAMARSLTEQAVTALGGMGRFVAKGDVVWVKPNIGWDRTPEQAANTNPDVVATVVRLCLEAGAKQVKVGDFTCNEAKQSYPNSGIESAVKAAGGDIVYLDPARFREVALKGKKLDLWPVYHEVLDADFVINVPIAKHHGQTTVTLCMKNYMGIVDNRQVFHQDLPTCIADITRFMAPKLCVLDAVRILTAHGPTGGDLADVKRMDTVAAGTDIVALDAFGCELLGHKPQDIGTVVAGDREGLGTMDYRSLRLKEIDVA